MNVVTVAPDGSYYRIYSVAMESTGKYRVQGVKVSPAGLVLSTGAELLPTLEAAKDRLRGLIRVKKKKQDEGEFPISDLPEPCRKFLLPDVETSMSPDEFIVMVRRARRERVVVFKDIDGLNGAFMPWDEYVGFQDPEDEDIVIVTGDDGRTYNCSTSRFESVRPSDRAVEAARRFSSVVSEAVDRTVGKFH